MRYKGKKAIWYYAIVIFANAGIIWQLAGSRKISEAAPLVLALIVSDLIFIPSLVRNYVVFQEDALRVAFGFLNEKIYYKDIVRVWKTHNPLASYAASLDRIAIKTRGSEFMISVLDKEKFLAEIKARAGLVTNRG
ncbi:PH domain-containing protein [Qiania dongpingensis]|uniref:PH domain-containing protein n=1 Tax=Qiania dongpingensis TaxID=2763669 RepID=A0A7G9G2M5_9FIRM|nr:PH domain-containing protein [Qiania dongpingensis]QNM05057.1 PH domain-containing protein [Qiania dongpingensis]